MVRQVQLQQMADGAIGLTATDGEAAELPLADFDQLRISSRIGNTPRCIYFPNGGKFETDDNQAIDRWLATVTPGLLSGLAHRLESRFAYVAIGLVVVLISGWLTFRYLIPALSTVIAGQLPAVIEQQLGQQSLQLMDQYVFTESTLPMQRQQQLRQLFQRYFTDTDSDQTLTLHFRHSERVGANAFALPSGYILLTDDLVRLAANDFELLAVLAHEVGHVKHRHIMRRVVQDSFLVFLITMVTGDISAVSSLVLAAPTVLLELAYSRQFEQEADRFALVFLQQQQIATVHFSNIMARIDYAAWSVENRSGGGTSG